MNENLTSGQRFEMDVLGACSSKKEFERNLKKPHRTFEECREEAVERAKVEGWDPEDPPAGLLISRLLLYINVYVGVVENLPYRVLVWRTVDTAFDYSHGVDLFFEVVDESGLETRFGRVDIDLSLNPNKDAVLGITIFGEYDFREENLPNTAIVIGKKLLAKLKGENRERSGVYSSEHSPRKI